MWSIGAACIAQKGGEEMTTPILVWPFKDAPLEYKVLSMHGGDEDWLALVPVELTGHYVPWLDNCGFGNDVSVHPLPDGRTVYIGAHA